MEFPPSHRRSLRRTHRDPARAAYQHHGAQSGESRLCLAAAQLFAYEHRNDRITPFEHRHPDGAGRRYANVSGAVPVVESLRRACHPRNQSDNDEAIFGWEDPRTSPAGAGRQIAVLLRDCAHGRRDRCDDVQMRSDGSLLLETKLVCAQRHRGGRPTPAVSPQRSGELVSTGPSSWQFVVKGAAPAGDCTPIPLSLDG